MAKFDAVTELTDSFRLVFRNFGGFVQTIGVVLLIPAVLSLVLNLTTFGPGMEAVMEAAENQDIAAMFAAIGPLVGAGIIISILGLLAAVAALVVGVTFVDGLHRGETLTLGQAWDAGKARFGNLFGTVVLIGLAMTGLMIAGALLVFLIVPLFAALAGVLYLFARWFVAAPVSVLEQQTVGGNLKRSSMMTKGAIGSILVAIVLLWLAIALPAVVVTLPLTLFMLAGSAGSGLPTINPVLTIVQWVLQTAVQLIGTFVGTALVMSVYRKLETPAVAPPEPTWAVPDQ